MQRLYGNSLEEDKNQAVKVCPVVDLSALVGKSENVKAAKGLSSWFKGKGVKAFIQRRAWQADDLKSELAAFLARRNAYAGAALTNANFAAYYTGADKPAGLAAKAAGCLAGDPLSVLQYDEIILTGKPDAFSADTDIVVTPAASITGITDWIDLCTAATDSIPYAIDYGTFVPIDSGSYDRWYQLSSTLLADGVATTVTKLHAFNSKLLAKVGKVFVTDVLRMPRARDHVLDRSDALTDFISLVADSKAGALTKVKLAKLRTTARNMWTWRVEAARPLGPPPPHSVLKHRKQRRTATAVLDAAQESDA